MLPGDPPKPKGGRLRTNRRQAIRGIFRILDNGAKWKDLPAEFGSKSSVHRAFKRWVEMGAFESLLGNLGELVEERSGFKLYECHVDGTLSKAKGGGDGISCTKAGKGVKIMIMVDAKGLPIAVNTGSASPHESTLVAPLFDFMITVDFPERFIGDKAYDSDKLEATMRELGRGHDFPAQGKPKAGEQNSRWPQASSIQATVDCRADDCLAPKPPSPVHSVEKVYRNVPILCQHSRARFC